MQVRAVANDARGFTLTAPVLANHNHLHTAFGGSINAVATLAAYGLLWLELGEDSPAHLVVVESSMRFLRPVKETIRATCLRPEKKELRKFIDAIAAREKARLRLHCVVEESALAAEFSGTFAALRSGER
ncbi:MAG: thioesterase domain-containing protein [Verrucomicrobiota bacterium]|nr:thioesterase domain-containing protein [Verrucomicrobiota bacterium]